MGLWMIQSIRRELNGIAYVVDEKAIRKGRLHQYMRVEGLGHEVGFADLIKAADEAEAAGVIASIVNVNDDRFLAPDSMIEEICAACDEAGQPVPETLGELHVHANKHTCSHARMHTHACTSLKEFSFAHV